MISRRNFNKNMVKGLGATALLGNQPLNYLLNGNDETSLGIALVGLGSYSEYQLAPSLQDTAHCHLAGIVTGTPEKAQKWSEKYNIAKESTYNYENFDDISNNKNIDVVYVALPNSMHAEFCIRAAKAGKHVICEKPMAISVEECDAIIDACKKANVKLSVVYRLQSEPYTQEVKRIVKEKIFGEIRYVSADAGYISRGNPNQWRLNKALSGGGALLNMGVYSIQSAIYGSGMNPTSVQAQEFSTRPEYFKDTDEAIAAQFEFPNGAVGNIFTSHNANVNRLYSSFDRGWVELNPANNYGPLSGRRSDGEVVTFPHKRQQALQMDDFAKHILTGSPNLAPGEMGKRDMIICEAIYRSIEEGGKRIPLDLGDMGIVRI
jgi:glucose-fructose oxidoreductase